MKIIEFFGPPGVGKTTMIDELLKVGLNLSCRKDIIGKKFNYNLWNLMNRDSHWKRFIKTIEQMESTVPNSKNYLRQIERSVRRTALLRSLNNKRIVLMDGGLCQRGLTMSLCKPTNRYIIDEYYNLIPKPLYVVMFKLDSKIIRLRNDERTKTGFGWNFANEAEELNAVCDNARKIFIKRRIDFLDIDANLPVSDNISKVLRWINDTGSHERKASLGNSDLFTDE